MFERDTVQLLVERRRRCFGRGIFISEERKSSQAKLRAFEGKLTLAVGARANESESELFD